LLALPAIRNEKKNGVVVGKLDNHFVVTVATRAIDEILACNSAETFENYEANSILHPSMRRAFLGHVVSTGGYPLDSNSVNNKKEFKSRPLFAWNEWHNEIVKSYAKSIKSGIFVLNNLSL
jgi:hypothetical protein